MNLIYALFPFAVLAAWLGGAKLVLWAMGNKKHKALRW